MNVRSRWKVAPAAILCIAISNGCCLAGGGYVSPEQLDVPAASLSSALTTFTTETAAKALDGYKRAARRDLIRADIRDVVVGNAANWTPEELAGALRPHKSLLCLPRYGYLRVAVPLQNTAAKAVAISSTLQASKDDLASLFKALTRSYTIDPTTKDIAADYDTWIRADTQGKPCADAVDNADPLRTRETVGRELGVVAAATAAKAVFEVVWFVIKPAVTGVLQNVDLERRNAAIKDYFANDANVAALKGDLSHVERYLTEEFKFAQIQTAGVAVVSMRALSEPDGPPWTAALAVMNGAECKAQFSKLAKDKTDPEAVACMGKVYAALDPALNTALDAGDAFDAVMDRQIPSSPLSEQVDTMAAIARGTQPNDEKLAALWSTLLRYATLFQEVQSVGSADNEKKIGDAIAALRKALQ